MPRSPAPDRPTPATPREAVVNLREFRDGLPPDVMRIDRRTPWGNPFRIGEQKGRQHGTGEPIVYTREDVIRLYRGWLSAVLAEKPDFLESLRGKRLACWCAPLPCHGDVIAMELAR